MNFGIGIELEDGQIEWVHIRPHETDPDGRLLLMSVRCDVVKRMCDSLGEVGSQVIVSGWKGPSCFVTEVRREAFLKGVLSHLTVLQ